MDEETDYFWFLTHHNLQGSQTSVRITTILRTFLTHHNLQGSQTKQKQRTDDGEFLTHHNLQGSQTQICILVITEPTCLTTAKL